MRAAALIMLFATLAVCVVSVAPATRDDDGRYRRAHAAAVKYREQRDDLQQRLTRRVREARGLRRTLVHRPSSFEALRLAAITWNVSSNLLYRIASCESTGSDPDVGPVSERTLYAAAKNPTSTASGLAQFLTSTWTADGMIYAHESIFSPYASALAMAREVHLGHTYWQWAASKGCWS